MFLQKLKGHIDHFIYMNSTPIKNQDHIISDQYHSPFLDYDHLNLKPSSEREERGGEALSISDIKNQIA